MKAGSKESSAPNQFESTKARTTPAPNRPSNVDARKVPGTKFRLGLFGTFFPASEMVGTFTTGLAVALSESEQLGSVVVFCQFGARLPTTGRWSRVRLEPCWAHDDPISLLRALFTLRRGSDSVDGFLFNTYVTAFGRSAAANVMGLLIPTSLALMTRKPVVTYMHNLLETQDAVQLGYRPSFWQRWGVRLLETLLLRTTVVVVLLESQQATVSRIFGVLPRKILIPFTMPFGLIASMQGPPADSSILLDSPARILLLGNWGPQKDLPGVLRALMVARGQGGRFTVSITGAINAHFPEYRTVIERIKSTMDPTWFHFLGGVPESELLNVVLNHDLVILPYNATGGYSGAMSVSAYCEVGIIAYDLPQLRESARELGIDPVFVAKDDTAALTEEILLFCSDVRARRERRRSVPLPEYDARVREGASKLIETLASLRGPTAHVVRHEK